MRLDLLLMMEIRLLEVRSPIPTHNFTGGYGSWVDTNFKNVKKNKEIK